jgi:predicted metal-dependent hydrolase
MDELAPAERERLLAAGTAAFNQCEFYEAHEHWETVWDVIDPPERTWLQGLIQIATGLHKLDRGRADVCETLLRKGLDKLAGAPDRPDTLGQLDVAGARAGAERILDTLARGERADAASVRLR